MLCQTIPMNKTNPSAVLHKYVPDGDGETRPAVLVLSGNLSEGDADIAARHLCAEGFHAFVLNCPAGAGEEMTALIAEAVSAIKTINDAETEAGPVPLSDEKPQQYYANIYEDRAGMFRHSPFSSEQLLVRHVMEGDEKAALETLGSINRYSAKAVLAKEPLRSVRNSIICSCTILTRAAIQAGVPDEEAFALSDAVILHIESLRSLNEVLAYEESMLLQVIKLVNKHRGKSYSTSVRRALHYIDSHLEQSILLKDVAEYAGVHPNYLSKRIRQETGVALSNYASMRKIREAAYFVQHTDYPMAEIAALYGFSSQSYFISSFKKVMRIPPGEYRSSEGRSGK